MVGAVVELLDEADAGICCAGACDVAAGAAGAGFGAGTCGVLVDDVVVGWLEVFVGAASGLEAALMDDTVILAGLKIEPEIKPEVKSEIKPEIKPEIEFDIEIGIELGSIDDINMRSCSSFSIFL